MYRRYGLSVRKSRAGCSLSRYASRKGSLSTTVSMILLTLSDVALAASCALALTSSAACLAAFSASCVRQQ